MQQRWLDTEPLFQTRNKLRCQTDFRNEHEHLTTRSQDFFHESQIDFGLARTAAPLKAAVDSESPTDVMTREGTLAGTLHYMSPEQAEGITVDTRSDIFSLGVVFFELLTGERPFQGDSPASTLSAVLKDEPQPIHELRPKLPRDLARIVRRCLVKDPEKRFQTSKDVRNELEIGRAHV